MKPIDNLRTNHQGIYVLQDNAFRFLSKIGSGKQHLDVAPLVFVYIVKLSLVLSLYVYSLKCDPKNLPGVKNI